MKAIITIRKNGKYANFIRDFKNKAHLENWVNKSPYFAKVVGVHILN